MHGIESSIKSRTARAIKLIQRRPLFPMSPISTGWTWGNGSAYNRSFDADGRVTSVNLGSVQRSYSYDAAGRLTGQVDVGPAGAASSSFAYDEAGQLTNYSGPAGSFTYDYDSNGNRRRTVRNGYASTMTYSPGSNRMLSSPRGSYSYDAAGNPTTDGYLSYGYDSFGRLSSMVTPDDRSIRSYNGQGLRVRSVVNQWISNVIQQGMSPATIQRSTTTVSGARTLPEPLGQPTVPAQAGGVQAAATAAPTAANAAKSTQRAITAAAGGGR